MTVRNTVGYTCPSRHTFALSLIQPSGLGTQLSYSYTAGLRMALKDSFKRFLL